MEELDILVQLRQIYADYLSELEKLRASLKLTDGLFGFGRSPGNDPCHARFMDTLEKALADFAAQEPASDTVSQALGFIFEAAQDSKSGSLSYWMLLAVHGLTGGLIGRLSETDAVKLSERYAALYPGYRQLPVQKDIAAKLRAASGRPPEQKKRLLSFFTRRQ
ncbi:MAG: hypothetical protein LBL15_07510 [Oscillospiraceae bacterium]|jgi:hypothetical protein|nr:hypothetical protein [Oscillospiraceae bacterium]